MTQDIKDLKATMIAQFKQALKEDSDFLRPLIQTIAQELLEEEMNEAVGARKGERSANRLSYRSGHYPRTLVTRVGKIELMVPQDREGRFSTAIFERYQRSEKALAGALIVPRNVVTTCEAKVCAGGCPPARLGRWPKSCADMTSVPVRLVG